MTKSGRKKGAAKGKRPEKGAGKTVTAPVAKARRGKVTGPARIMGNPYAKGGNMRVKHREYIGEIYGSVDSFAVRQFAVNPGIPETFPWLSSLALDFEKYRFESLRFVYEPEAPTSASGYVMMALDYDAADEAAPTKQEMGASLGAVRSPPWATVADVADKDVMRKRGDLFVRSGVPAANLDIKTYDLATLNLATGNGLTVLIGELWVEYEVVFSIPQMNLFSRIQGNSLRYEAEVVSLAAPFGTGEPRVRGGLPYHIDGLEFYFDRVGVFLLEFAMTGTAMQVNGEVFDTSGSTVAEVAVLNSVKGNAALTNGLITYQVVVTQGGQMLSVNPVPVAATLSAMVLRIAPYAVPPQI